MKRAGKKECVMRGNIKLAILAVAAGVGFSLAGCVSPARTPSDAYAPSEQQTTTTYYGPAGQTTTTTTTQTTVDENGYGYGPSGHGNTYDDPHHYGRGYNQHKY